ncbi:hypothetical protein P9X07_21575, partial [Bacillus thuringiensis]|nr:hypothetical protein [Bacillus thuringiensis]
GNRVFRFVWTQPHVNTEEKDCAVFEMMNDADKLKAAKEAGEASSYPFDSFIRAGRMDVDTAIKTYLPGIFR